MNDVVIIKLDRERKLRYGHKALKLMEKLVGWDINNDDLDLNFSLEELEKVIFCGLKADDPELKLEDMEDLLDLTSYDEIMDKLNEAFSASFGAEIIPQNAVSEGEVKKK